MAGSTAAREGRRRHGLWALGVLAVLGSAPAAAAPSKSETCVLHGPLAVSAKPKNLGRKSKLAVGTKIELVGQSAGWVQLKAAGQDAYAALTAVRRACTPPGKPGAPDTLAELPLEPLMEAPAGSAPATPPTLASPPPPMRAPAAPRPDEDDTPPQMTTSTPVPADMSVRATSGGSLRAVRLGLWVTSGVTLAAACGLYLYNTAEVRKLQADIDAYNALPYRPANTAASLQSRRQRAGRLDAITLASAGLALGSAAAALVWTLADAGDDFDTASAPPMGVSLGPSSIGVWGRF